MTTTYLNFDLLVDRSPIGSSYRARVIQSPAGEAVTDFSLPFTEDELANVGWRTANGVRHLGAAPDGVSPALDLRGYGARLYGAAFAGRVGLCLRRSLDEAERRGVGLRIRLRLDAGVLDLAVLPWEFLFAPDLERFLALSDLTPIVRYIELDRPVQPLRAHLPLTIVAVISNPSDANPLAVESEWRRLQEALDPLIQRGVITLERLEAATLTALQARLRRGSVDLLHFVGHGSFDAQSNTGGLVFEKGNGRAEMVTAETLGMLLHDHEALRLIFLNACEGAQGGRSDPFAGVAQRLVQQGAPAVLAMQFPVTDVAAIALSQVFYQALADGLPADTALSQARKAIRAAGNDREWATPVLFSRSDDNRLFDLRDVLPAPPCPYPGMLPFRAEDARFFYGREGEIQQMLDHLRHQRLLLVIGPSGSGKSSLIAAGLLPRLEKSTYFAPGFWLVRTMRPLDHPIAALAACLEGDVSQPEQAVGALLAARAPAQRLLLVIDQFEEAFSLADMTEGQQFMAALQTLRSCQQCALVIALRADFFPDLMNCELWPVDPGQRLEVAVLRGGALHQAIRQPAADVEVEIDEALIERLLADAAGEPGALPMLQETLVLLWERMSRRHITLRDYNRLGDGQRSGLSVAIATKADATLAELPPDEQDVARRVFLRLIQFGQGRLDTRRQLPEPELRSAGDNPQTLEQVLKHLTGNRLLTLSGSESNVERLVDIAHERLISDWPRLMEWVKVYKEAEQTRRRLEDKAQEWLRLGGGEGGLLDNLELAEAHAWISGPDTRITGVSTAVLNLVSESERNINPGWHRVGSVALFAGLLSILGLSGLVLLYVQTDVLPGTIQAPVWLSLSTLLAIGIGLVAIRLRKTPYYIQQLSHRLGMSRLQISSILALVLLTISLWVNYGESALRINRICQSIGFRKGERNIALRISGLSEDENQVVKQVILNEMYPQGFVANVHAISDKDNTSCKPFVTDEITITRVQESTNHLYKFTVRDIEAGSQKEELLPGENSCPMVMFVAREAARWLLDQDTSSVKDLDAKIPTPTECPPHLWNEKGVSFLGEGRLKDAEMSFRRAISLSDTFALAYNNLGATQVRMGNYADAIGNLQKAAALTADSYSPTLVELATAYFRVGAYDDAIYFNQKALEVDSDNLNACNNLAIVYREQDDFAKAQSTIDICLAKAETLPDGKTRDSIIHTLLKNKGILYFKVGKVAEADSLLDAARAYGSRHAEEIVYYLARIAEARQDPSTECNLWREYQMIGSVIPIWGDTERRAYANQRLAQLKCND